MRRPAPLELVDPAGSAAGEDVGQPLDVGARDDVLTTLVLLAQAVDQLGAQDVDLAVEDPAPVGHLLLLVRELLDEVLELLVREGAEIGKSVHGGEHSNHQPVLEGRDARPSRTYFTVDASTNPSPT